jgi:hypothetical protein
MSEKTIKKTVKSTSGLVLYILHTAGGSFLSCNEIVSKIYEKFKCSVMPDTVRAALEEIDFTTDILIERTERRGEHKQPVKVFSVKENYFLEPQKPTNESV